MATIPFSIRNRWSGEVQFTAQIECAEDALPGVKVGLAVKWARDNRAVLTDAVLTGAVLTDAVLTRADLTGADLAGAVLTDADLTRADLTGAVLTDAVLTRADLTGAVLTDAVLTGAVLTDADLTRADLTGAVLTDAVLTGAVLTDADLTRADLTGAVLTDAVLRSFKADLWLTLASAQAEIPGLIAALREGRINGSCYSGSCACLVGTIANIRGVNPYSLDHGARRPAEQWFAMIRPGDKPGDATGGGFAAQWALTECLEFCRAFGIDAEVGASQGGEVA